MGFQIKSRINKNLEEPIIHSDGEVLMKVNGNIIFKSDVIINHFWGLFLVMIEEFIKKEKTSTCSYYQTNFYIKNGKRKDELIFSIESDEKRYRLKPIKLNKKEFLEKTLDSGLLIYKELSKMDAEKEWDFEYFIKHIMELKKEF